MARQPRLRTLSLFLLRDHISDWDQAVKDLGSLESYDARGAPGLLVVAPQRRKAPWWRDYVAPHVHRRHELEGLFNASTGALFLFEAGGRRFALAFGQGRHLLQPEAFEYDFGLRVVLNSVDAERIRSVDARSIDELTMHTRRSASRESDFEDFGLDVARDLVRAVAGPPRDETLGRHLAGADRLAISTRAQLDDLPELGGRLLAAYESTDYRERFPWVDKLRPIRDAELRSALDERLLEAIHARELDDFHLAAPEPLDPLRLAGFGYSTDRDGELDPDPRISRYLESLRDPERLTIDRLKRDRIVAFESEGEQVHDSWRVYNCIVYETERNGSLHVLSGGDWFQVSADFQAETVDYIESLPELSLEFPPAPVGIHEDKYNELAAEKCDCLNLDRKLVRVSGRSGVELCDLLSRNRQLIHVKRRGCSSTLSHLFAQGRVSAQLMLGDQPFRTASRDMVDSIDSSYTSVLPNGRPDPGRYEIAYAVVSRATPANRNPYSLPFFSLVNLRSTATALQDFGFKVSLARVPEH